MRLQIKLPELELLQNAADAACKVQTRLRQDIFLHEYKGATDVSQSRLPNRTSLIQSRGDFILRRFTGSEMYEEIRRTLLPIHEMAAQLPVRTVEKATLEWMISIVNWIESIHPEDDFRHQLGIKIKHALEVFLQFCIACRNSFIKYNYSKSKIEAEALVEKLENHLNHPFFKEIERVTAFFCKGKHL